MNIPQSNDDVGKSRPMASLLDLLSNAAKSENGMYFVSPILYSDSGSRETTFMSYQSLLDIAKINSIPLRRYARGLKTEIVLIHQDTIQDNIVIFWSVVMAGLIPAMSTPLSADAQQRYVHLMHLKDLLQNPLCVVSESLATSIKELSVLDLVTKEKIMAEALCAEPSSIGNCHEDLAALMLTSGSTGNAKAVELSFSQIYASVIGKSVNWESKHCSTFLNWIGLDHVANLVEIHFQAMLLGAQQVHVQASDLLAEPLLFLRLVNEHRVNYTFAPNFFLALLGKAMISSDPSDPIHQADLSCLRSIMSGGEANVLETAMRVTSCLQSLGAQGQVIRLGYGLTEACAALAYGILDPEYEYEEHHEFASIGKPITGALMRVCKDGIENEQYVVGELEISGPVVFRGYFRDQEATKRAFTPDGWFKTGDQAYVDRSGKFNLVGRSKEVLNINGVKFAPQDIETALEKANLKNVVASYFAAFAYRAQESSTEGYCIAYCAKARDDETVEHIAEIGSSLLAVRPNWIIPLSQNQLDKSSLGKLSRTKLQAMFSAGAYDDVKVNSEHPVLLEWKGHRCPPKSQTQQQVVETCSAMLNIPVEKISMDQTIFELGVTSISLFRFEKLLRQRCGLGKGVSIITFLSNPLLWAIADAIDNNEKRIYNPVAKIQSKGDKTPLWLVHPASGNTLAFLPLARSIKDRPLFALTARGLRNNEQMFSSITEMADTYLAHVKQAQPNGPYALTGYSLGTTVAFELAKRLEASGETVAFCGALDSPPHIIPLVQDLDWTAAAVLVTYFLELIPQTQVPFYINQFQGLSKIEVVKQCLDVSTPAQRAALNLDPEQLLAIVNITDNFGSMAKTYHPDGSVGKIDVFYCTPLHSVERDRESWIHWHLSRWQDFSRDQIEFHECEGDHADMLNPTYVEGFEKRLSRVLQARGL